MTPGNPTRALHRIIWRLLSLYAEVGHPPLDTHRIIRRHTSIHLVNARLRSFLPKCHLSCSKLHVLTTCHVFTPLPRTAKGHLPRRSNATPRIASLIRQGTRVNLACSLSTSS